MATAFHRNTMTNTEGGTDDEEFRVAAIKDRVDTTAQVWMGLTMGCAKCHSHKYDPITNEEYYKFYAFFNQTADSDRADESPIIPAPTPEWNERVRQINARIAELRKTLETPTPALLAAQAAVGIDSRPVKRGRSQGRPQGDLEHSRYREPSKRTKPQSEALARHFRTVAPELKPLRDQIAALEKSKPAIPTLPVMVELPAKERRVTRVLNKGNFLDQGETVAPARPAGASPVSARCPTEPAGAGAMARRSSEPADGSGGGQSLLGADLRQRLGRDRGRLRDPGRTAQPSRAARLAGRLVPGIGLEHQGAACG